MTKLEKGKGLRRPPCNVKESHKLMRKIYLILCISCAVSFYCLLSYLHSYLLLSSFLSAIKIWNISVVTIAKGLC